MIVISSRQINLFVKSNRLQVYRFCFGKQTGAGNEPNTQRDFQREAGTAPGSNINGKLGMLPVFKLVVAHPEFAPGNYPEAHIA